MGWGEPNITTDFLAMTKDATSYITCYPKVKQDSEISQM